MKFISKTKECILFVKSVIKVGLCKNKCLTIFLRYVICILLTKRRRIEMRILWDGSSEFNTATKKTYKTYDNAVKAATDIAEMDDVTVIIAATPEGRFFPVAIGEKALQCGLHFHMSVAA
jgi:hypothetical protein